MSESIEKYKQYDFAHDQECQEYIKKIQNDQPNISTEKLQRKWYKKNKDQNFDVDFIDSDTSKPQAQQQQQQSAQPSQPRPQARPAAAEQPQNHHHSNQKTQRKDVPYLTIVENYCKIFFFGSALVLPGIYTKSLAFIVCLLAIVRNYGKPPGLDKEAWKAYGGRVLYSEFFTNFVYLIGISLARDSLCFYLPIGIHFASGVAEYLSTNKHAAYLKLSPLRRLCDYIKANRNEVLLSKQKVEIFLFFYTIVGLFIGTTSLMQLVLMLQYIGIKMKFNQNMRLANQEVQGTLLNFARSSKCPGILRIVIERILWAYNKVLNFF